VVFYLSRLCLPSEPRRTSSYTRRLLLHARRRSAISPTDHRGEAPFDGDRSPIARRRRVALKLWLRWFGSALVAANLCGCTMMSWDDLTSREFSVRSLWTTPPPPLVVIERSSDGYARTKALNKLDETGKVQQQLFDQPDCERNQGLDRVADQITSKFGKRAIRRGAGFGKADD